MKLRFLHYDSLASTNETADELARLGAEEGTVVVAKEQCGGHGRKERRWTSPRGGLWFTLILRPAIDPSRGAQVSLLAGAAAAGALRKLYGTEKICIKWPNDLLLAGRKIGGILSEMRMDEHGNAEYILVGTGVNVNLMQTDFPPELSDTATSLLLALGKSCSVKEVLHAVMEEWDALYEPWQMLGARAILPVWTALNCTLGSEVLVKDEERVIFQGRAVSIEDTGALAVQSEDGFLKSFDFGEISIRPM